MLRLIIAVLLLSLMGCAAAPEKVTTLEPAQSYGGVNAFATLASFGTFEMELAPQYTRLAVLRHNAANKLRKGQIDLETAQKIQMYGDVVRSRLQEAQALDAAKNTEKAHAMLYSTAEALDHLEEMLP
jgi:hypothetical protein